jgi:hypothetical protein
VVGITTGSRGKVPGNIREKRIRNNNNNKLLLVRPCGLFQFRTTSEIMNQLRHMVGLIERVISPSQGLYLHRTTQHRKTRKNIHALSGIRTHDPSIQEAKTHALDLAATEMLNNNINGS